MEIGVDSFAAILPDPATGRLPSATDRVADLLDEVETADRVGLDVFGIGEHHRDDFAVSAPDVVLTAIAAQTERIKLGTAVTVLSSDDPIRVHQRFATLDAVSNGRAEIIMGRGSFTESFPLFGLELKDYEVLFEEKLNLFAEVVLVFNQYKSIMIQESSADRVLPMALEASEGDGDSAEEAGASIDYVFEPDGGDLLGRLLPMALRTRLFQAFLETQAGEQAKRMTAMDSATRNASDLIDQLTLDYNRARQAAITKELIEIVSGAEAL